MFGSRKKVFAGKGNLQPQPFCPVISSAEGYSSLFRLAQTNTGRPHPLGGGFRNPELTLRFRSTKM